MPHVNCDSGDDFTSLWRKILTEIKLYRRGFQTGFNLDEIWKPQQLADDLPESISTGDVRKLLAPLAANFLVVIIIDEFDRLPDGKVRTMIADTVKMLSDHSVGITMILIGVADSVDDLIAEHLSIERNLIQVPMPRMSIEEVSEIVTRGLSKLQMSIEPAALARITLLSRGLPHYTHLLARLAARNAIDDGVMRITWLHVEVATIQAVNEAQRTTSTAYHAATSSQRKDALYRYVLLACAMAQTDELGFFAPADIRAPLNQLMKPKVYDIPNFQKHLNEFCDRKRGAVLHKEGISHRYRYRFSDPMMQPFVMMKGFMDGWLSNEAFDDPADWPSASREKG